MFLRLSLLLSLLLLLASCNRKQSEGVVQPLLQQKQTITSIAFEQFLGGVPVLRTSLNRNATGNWLIDSLRLVNTVRFTAWWDMLADLQEHPIFFDESSLSNIIDTLQQNGLKVTVQAEKSKPLCFYLHKFNNIGVIALANNKTYLLYLPFIGSMEMEYWSAQPNYWQDMTVFAYQPAEIDTIRVIYSKDSSASFELVHEQDTAWSVRNSNGVPLERVNNSLLQQYISYYDLLRADSILYADNKLVKEIVDQKNWQYSIYVAGHHKANRTVQCYAIPAASGKGEDIDKCFIYIVETKETALASWRSFDLLLKKFQDFVDKK